MSKVELMLPYQGQIDKALVVSTGLQIGDVIISPEKYWANNQGFLKFDLLDADGSTVVQSTHPALYSIRTVLETIHREDNCPFEYKYVADYTGVPNGTG